MLGWMEKNLTNLNHLNKLSGVKKINSEDSISYFDSIISNLKIIKIGKSNNQKDIALNNQWIDWSNSVFGLNCSTYTAHNILLPIEKRNPNLASEAKKNIYSCFEILNTKLEKSNYLLDDKLSLADIPIGCLIHRCVILNLEISEFKSLEKMYVNLKERSAFKTEVFYAPLPPE